MKNNHLLILLILFLSIPAFTQEYLPLVRPDAEWSIHHQLQIDRMMVFDQLGRTVYQAIQQEFIGNIRIDATTWSPGIYFLVVTQDKKAKVMKLIKSGH